MKRKVIQIAGSTQLVSLPRQWAKKHDIRKGQEVEVSEEGDTIIINTDTKSRLVKVDVDISNLEPMTHRLLGSYYRAGVDEIRVTYKDPKMIEIVYDSLARETMIGIEIINQSENNCVLRYVAGSLEEFDALLRRIFLLLINMSEETARLLREGRFDLINNLSMLERTNNRLTTMCRRIINKTPSLCTVTTKVGPIYTIIETLENLADEYKYICNHYSRIDGKTKLSSDVLKLFENATSLIRKFYELFYKFDFEKLTEMKSIREKVIKDSHKLFKMNLSSCNVWLVHHAIMVTTITFNMTGPYIVTKV